MLDNAVINIAAAEMLADLSSDVQSTIINVLTQHPEMKLTGANVKELHDESNLTTTAITKILKPKPPVKIAVPAEIVSEFMEGKTPEELTEIVSAAIRRYFTEEHDVKIYRYRTDIRLQALTASRPTGVAEHTAAYFKFLASELLRCHASY